MNPFNGISERKERRAARRASYDTAVSCEFAGQKILDYTANLSVGGVYIRAGKAETPVGAPVKVTLRVPGMAQRTALDGVVVRVDINEDGAGVAVRFAAVPAEVESAISSLVSTH